jgi:hypothetical protein
MISVVVDIISDVVLIVWMSECFAVMPVVAMIPDVVSIVVIPDVVCCSVDIISDWVLVVRMSACVVPVVAITLVVLYSHSLIHSKLPLGATQGRHA